MNRIKKIFYLIIIISCIAFCFWYGSIEPMLILLFPILSIILKTRFSFYKNLRKNLFFVILKSGIITFFIILFIKVFLADIYYIPSSSMENTLFPGDKIVVNKLSLGPRMPQKLSEISWLQLIFNLEESNQVHTCSYKRLKGYSSLHRNDIIVFNNPQSASDFLVKRCIGIPGDNLSIVKNDLFINGMQSNEPGTIKHQYKIIELKMRTICEKLQQEGISSFKKEFRNNKLNVLVELSNNEYQKLEETGLSKYLIKLTDSIVSKSNLRIPHKGYKIKMDISAFELYSDIINNYENHKLVHNKHSFLLNGKEISTYTFQDNYYYVLGDNRPNSTDSRVFGLVPEKYIIGKII